MNIGELLLCVRMCYGDLFVYGKETVRAFVYLIICFIHSIHSLSSFVFLCHFSAPLLLLYARCS